MKSVPGCLVDLSQRLFNDGLFAEWRLSVLRFLAVIRLWSPFFFHRDVSNDLDPFDKTCSVR